MNLYAVSAIRLYCARSVNLKRTERSLSTRPLGYASSPRCADSKHPRRKLRSSPSHPRTYLLIFLILRFGQTIDRFSSSLSVQAFPLFSKVSSEKSQFFAKSQRSSIRHKSECVSVCRVRSHSSSYQKTDSQVPKKVRSFFIISITFRRCSIRWAAPTSISPSSTTSC